MDNDNSGDIYIRLGLDEKEFYAGLDRAQSGVLALTESVQQSGERLDSMTKMPSGRSRKNTINSATLRRRLSCRATMPSQWNSKSGSVNWAA